MAMAMQWGCLSSNNNTSTTSPPPPSLVGKNPNSVKKREWGEEPLIKPYQLPTSTTSYSPPPPPLSILPMHEMPKDSDRPCSTSAPPWRPSPSKLDDMAFNLPSADVAVPWGWERCLDLKSGQVYLVRSIEDNLKMEGANKKSMVNSKSQRRAIDWLEGKPSSSSSSSSHSYHYYTKEEEEEKEEERDYGGNNDRGLVELKLFDDVTLDLELNLTTKLPQSHPMETIHSNMHSNNNNDNNDSVSKNYNHPCPPFSLIGIPSQSSKSGLIHAGRENWTASLGISEFSYLSPSLPHRPSPLLMAPPCLSARPSNIGSDSTSGAMAMATATCGKCLTYVLLWKNNPTCPRCGSHVLLHCSNKGQELEANHQGHQEVEEKEREEEEMELLPPPFKKGRRGPNNTTFFTIEDCTLAISKQHKINHPSKSTTSESYNIQWNA